MKFNLILSTALIFFAQFSQAAIDCGGWDAQHNLKVSKIKIVGASNGGFSRVELTQTNLLLPPDVGWLHCSS